MLGMIFDNMNKTTKEISYTVDSDKLIKEIIEDGSIQFLGAGDRFDESEMAMDSDIFKTDNTYNWELTGSKVEEGYREYYHLSNDFEIRETDQLLIISKHIGVDIRGGYELDRIYLKTEPVNFYELVSRCLVGGNDYITKDNEMTEDRRCKICNDILEVNDDLVCGYHNLEE